MKCKFIEATNLQGGGINYGKFAVCEFEHEEWAHSQGIEIGDPNIPRFSLLRSQGWTPDHRFVIDLATGEGIMTCPRLGSQAVYDLEKHKVWVCPLFQPFLQWLHDQGSVSIDSLPYVVNLPEAPSDLWGYRRSGPVKPFILGQIESVFEVKGRGLVVIMNSHKILSPPGWELRPGDQLAVGKSEGDDLKTVAVRIEKGTASETSGIVLRGLSQKQVVVGDLLLWLGRVVDSGPVVFTDPIDTPTPKEQ